MWTLSGFADEIDPDLKTQCATLNELGITHVEFRSAWDTNVLDLTDEQVEEAAAILAAHDLSVSSIGSPLGKINIEDDFDAHLVRADRALAVAQRLGAPFIRIFSFFLRPDQAPEQHRDEVLRRMAALAERAAPTGIVLLHENEKDIYGDVPERVLDIVESVGSPALRLAWDPANYVQVGVRPFTEGYATLRPHTGVRAGEGRGAGDRRRGARRRGRRAGPGDRPRAGRRRLRRLLLDGATPGHLQRVRRALRARELHPGHPRVHGHPRERRDRVRMSEHKLRFALVGAGFIGGVHARELAGLDEAELVAVVDTDRTKAEALATRYGAPVATTDLDAVLRRDDVDAVSICTPTGVHADGAVAALDAGKHVVVEKPLDVTLAAADRIIDAEKRSGKTVAVISQHRFDRSSEKVLQAVRDGHLGTITSAIASHAWWRGQSYYDSGDWRGTWALDGGGAVMNQTVHTIDLMTTVVGTPIEVFAYTACLAHERIEVEDTAIAVVKFASGALGIIHGTTAAYPGLDASLRVFGSKGSAVISDDELVFLHENAGEAPEIAMSEMTGANQVTDEFRLEPEDLTLGRAHRRQLADFVEAVTTGRPPRVGTAEARTALSVILAMYESAASGCPVKL